jgi:broad specificity phosphatase PhoE
MRRCRETAQELIAASGWRGYAEEESLLLPKASGSLSGHARDLIHRRAAEAGIAVAEYREPGGESTIDVMRRAVEAWHRRVTPDGMQGDVLLISHGDVLACLLLHLCGLDYGAFPQAVLRPGEAVVFPVAHPPRDLDELRAAMQPPRMEEA